MSLVKNIILQKKEILVLVQIILLQSFACGIQIAERTRLAVSVNSELLKACIADDSLGIISLLAEGANVNAKDNNGWITLHYDSDSSNGQKKPSDDYYIGNVACAIAADAASKYFAPVTIVKCLKPSQLNYKAFDNSELLTHYVEQGERAADDFFQSNEHFFRLLQENRANKHPHTL